MTNPTEIMDRGLVVGGRVVCEIVFYYARWPHLHDEWMVDNIIANPTEIVKCRIVGG